MLQAFLPKEEKQVFRRFQQSMAALRYYVVQQQEKHNKTKCFCISKRFFKEILMTKKHKFIYI